MHDVYHALAHPARRKILALLRKKALSAGEIADEFDLSKPTLSGHFNVLREADLVSVERRGATLIYRINLSVAEEAMTGLMEIFRISDAAPKEPARATAEARRKS